MSNHSMRNLRRDLVTLGVAPLSLKLITELLIEVYRSIQFLNLVGHKENSKMIEIPQSFDTMRLHLRRFVAEDAASVYKYTSDPVTVLYMDWSLHKRFSDAEMFISEDMKRWTTGEEYCWAITIKESDQLIGSMGCRVRDHRAQFGFIISRTSWGKGYATEAALAIKEWLSSQEEIRRIWATCDIENKASVRVLDRIGMTREGVLRNWAARPNMTDQPVRDALVFSFIC